MKKEKRSPKKKFDPDELNELFGLTVVKTVRIPTDLFDEVDTAAKQQGSNFNDTVINALRAFLGKPTEEGVQFIQKLYKWVTKKFAKTNFPENVTHLVFQHIQKTPELLEEYQQILQSHGGRETINRRIGKMVKQSLGATVVGRSLPLSHGDLITSYALLRPTETTKLDTKD